MFHSTILFHLFSMGRNFKLSCFLILDYGMVARFQGSVNPGLKSRYGEKSSFEILTADLIWVFYLLTYFII